MKGLAHSRRYLSGAERKLEKRLERIQGELPPGHEQDFLVINTDTDEYVVGKTREEAMAAFEKRWPEAGFFRCRVDGGPFTKMYRRSQ